MRLMIDLRPVRPRVNGYGIKLAPFQVAIEKAAALNFKVRGFARTDTALTIDADHPGDARACARWLAEELGQPSANILTD